MRAAAKHALPILPLLPSFSSFPSVSEQNGGPKKALNPQIRGTEGSRALCNKLGNRHTLCRRFGKGLACVGPSGRQNLPTIKVYQPTAGMNRVTIV